MLLQSPFHSNPLKAFHYYTFIVHLSIQVKVSVDVEVSKWMLLDMKIVAAVVVVAVGVAGWMLPRRSGFVGVVLAPAAMLASIGAVKPNTAGPSMPGGPIYIDDIAC